MYAVIQTGGKQYRVTPGQTVRVEKLEGKIGTEVTLEEVLAVAADGAELKVGRPTVEGARVTAEIVEQHRSRKVLVFKFKKRKRVRKKTGHRQPYTALRIKEIVAD
ncbi:MAG TPA: 50S ribosomal protein L21 [Candidatus Nitrosotenuis sp.]|jgi:large subunit ribosomal protein L21|nr:50S ribosomal protein L21 [Candidatus Nitrosotenuis sp.]